MNHETIKHEWRLRFGTADLLRSQLEARLRSRPGISVDEARDIATKCSDSVYGNAKLTGAIATIVVGLGGNVLAGLEAGLGTGALIGAATLVFGRSCEPFSLEHYMSKAIQDVRTR